jgi:lipopolysaccharide export system ATP-binding protein
MDGVDVTHLPMYRRAILGLGYLPQETSIFRGMTVAQNIACVLEMVEPDKTTRMAELDRLLEEFHLTKLRDSPASSLGGALLSDSRSHRRSTSRRPGMIATTRRTRAK